MNKLTGQQRPLHGRVKRLFFQDGYGFLENEDGHEIYFHENSVLSGKFSALDVGTEVIYSEEMGDKGPQASSLKPVGRHGFHVFPRHKSSVTTESKMRNIQGPSIPTNYELFNSNFRKESSHTGGKLLMLGLGAVVGAVAMLLLDPEEKARRTRMLESFKNWQTGPANRVSTAGESPAAPAIRVDDMRTGAMGSELNAD